MKLKLCNQITCWLQSMDGDKMFEQQFYKLDTFFLTQQFKNDGRKNYVMETISG
jgi:hypothetical protein